MPQLDYEEPRVGKDVMWILEKAYGNGMENEQTSRLYTLLGQDHACSCLLPTPLVLNTATHTQ